MIQPTDSKPAQSKQDKIFASEKKGPRRRLEHLADLQEGVDKFDMVPRCLSRAYFDKKIPEPKYKLLRIMMSHGEYFRVKRNYLEGKLSKDSLTKYLPQLVSEGYLECEIVASTHGGYENIYHVRSLYDWPLYRQSVDRLPVDGRPTVDHKDTNPSSSCSLPAPEILTETKAEKPCHNGGVDLTQASITPTIAVKKAAPPLGKGVALDLGQVVQFVKSMEFAYKLGKKGNYDWEVANEAAERFILERGNAACSILLDWAVAYTGFQKGCVKVNKNMFDRLWAIFEEDQHLVSLAAGDSLKKKIGSINA
jgi:hypothetical protein